MRKTFKGPVVPKFDEGLLKSRHGEYFSVEEAKKVTGHLPMLHWMLLHLNRRQERAFDDINESLERLGEMYVVINPDESFSLYEKEK